MEIKGKVKQVAISRLQPNPWNPNVQSEFIFEKERASIREHGFIDPVLVRTIGDSYEIIDGEHRWRAAKAEGGKEIMILDLGKVEDVEAKRLTIIMNETRGKSDHDKLVALIRDIGSSDGTEKLMKLMPYSETELQSYLKEAAVDWDAIGSSLWTEATFSVDPEPMPPVDPPRGADSAKDEPGKRVISISVDEALHCLFFEQIDRINKILTPEMEPQKLAPAPAIEAILAIMQHTSDKAILATAIEKNKGKMLKKRASNKSKSK